MPAKTHGRTNTKEYRTWENMKKRCHTPTDSHYPRWGGRGIFVCDRWRNSFVNFLSDMGEAPTSDHQIERMDNNGPYSPNNCRWAHKSEQAGNTRKNRLVTFQGSTMTVTAWARHIGIAESALKSRLNNGWSTEAALTTPSSHRNRPNNRFIEHNGQTKILAEWAREYGISSGMLWRRLHLGLEMHDALTRPPQRRKKLLPA